MKYFKAYLVALVLTGISPATYASINSSLDSETITGISNNQEAPVVMASNTGIQIGLENQIASSGISAANSKESIPITTAGIIFALVLLGTGSLVGRKKKAKGSDIVGAFARIN